MKVWLAATLALLIGLAIGAGGGWALSRPSADSSPSTKASGHQPTTGVLRLVCDLELDKGKDVFGINPSEAKRVGQVGIDFDRSSGWYDGALAISESRPGGLTYSGNLLTVKRPALFQRFGAQITGEEFTINRETGEFQQQLTINTGFQIPLIKGRCARLVKAPF